MLRLPQFDYIQPRSLKEAAKALADLGPDAMVVAGGTDVYPKMKRGQFSPRHLVSLKSLNEIRGIRIENGGGLWIGAGETLSRVACDPIVKELLPSLSQSAGMVSSPQLRNVGTIGGNVLVDTRCNYYDQSSFWRRAAGFCMKKSGEICLVAPGSKTCLAVFSSDTAPVLCSLNAAAVLAGREGSRRVPLAELYRNDGIHFLAKRSDELLQALVIPRSAFGQRGVYLKLCRRGSFDFPVLGVAAVVDLNEQRRCTSARVVLTAVASAPVIVDAARLLEGERTTRDGIEAVADAAAVISHPVDNADMDYWYRKRMTKVYVRRALAHVAGVDLGSP
jgi:4-hydroxybenzoyl-CoA reductase subunit beta